MYIIAGTYKRRKLVTPVGLETRPTTGRLRESLFNICQSLIEDARFLDLFAGSGAMGLEALSRGAASAVFVDNNKECIRCIKKNIENLKLENRAHPLLGDLFQTLIRMEKQSRQFDIIYADPPYGSRDENYSLQLIQAIDKSNLLAPSGVFFLEEDSSVQPIKEGLQTLRLVSSRTMGRAALHEYQKKDLSLDSIPVK